MTDVDIVTQLRAADIGWSGDAACVSAEVAAAGADEIERLRTTIANLQQIAGKASIDGQTFAQVRQGMSPHV